MKLQDSYPAPSNLKLVIYDQPLTVEGLDKPVRGEFRLTSESDASDHQSSSSRSFDREMRLLISDYRYPIEIPEGKTMSEASNEETDRMRRQGEAFQYYTDIHQSVMDLGLSKDLKFSYHLSETLELGDTQPFLFFNAAGAYRTGGTLPMANSTRPHPESERIYQYLKERPEEVQELLDLFDLAFVHMTDEESFQEHFQVDDSDEGLEKMRRLSESYSAQAERAKFEWEQIAAKWRRSHGYA